MISKRRFVTVGARLCVLLSVGSAFATVSIDSFASPSPAKSVKASAFVDFIELTGVIDPVSSKFLIRQITSAEDGGSTAVVVRLDTPGGLDVSMREMVQKILGSKVPIVVWVAPSGARSASAGVFLTYAAGVAAMAPGTNIGAAHPVDLGGKLDKVESQKAANDAAALLRSIAKQRGRSVEFAERAVKDSASIDAQEAVRLGVVDYTAKSIPTLLEGLEGRSIDTGSGLITMSKGPFNLRFHKMNLLERLLHSAVRPEVAYLLLLVGFYGLIFELYNPGIGAAGVMGGISLIFGFYALSILPTSWAGVALLLLAVGFFLADLHVAGLGIFTVGGTVSLIVGSLLLFSGAAPALRLPLWAVAGAVAATVLFFLSIMTAAIRARTAKPISGAEGIVGTFGTARTDIAPDGQVTARGTLWRARTLGAAIAQGTKVEIRGVSGLMLIVEPAVGPEGGNNGRGV